ncbi:hypothetical protein [Hyphomonas sp.]|uniref:hypothetical protein n=1 Tax=Hyphomonas sp. TaxID=87 RepID=UPI001BCBDC58|nr:hypothetical protein [Hyphomonas sp.]
MTINGEPPAPGKPLLRAGLPTRAALMVLVVPALAETPEEIEAERAVRGARYRHRDRHYRRSPVDLWLGLHADRAGTGKNSSEAM